LIDLFIYLLFYVPLKNISLRWRRLYGYGFYGCIYIIRGTKYHPRGVSDVSIHLFVFTRITWVLRVFDGPVCMKVKHGNIV
jgi:hypothetical protein